LPVLFAIDRAGIVGADGPTHAGMFDLSFLRCIPNIMVMAPADENECRQMLSTGLAHNGPSAVRYPRGSGPGVNVEKNMDTLPIAQAQLRRQGGAVALLAFGAMVIVAEEAADALNASVVNMRFIKPIDEAMILDMADKHQLLVTIEDNVIAGGAGSAVNEVLMDHDIQIPVINLGLPDEFVEHGEREQLLSLCGLDAQGIIKAVQDYYESRDACDFSLDGVNSH
ncbi:MAG: 1-deoxy-D-xylulose-5-phosphate synthase, partial [Gammaproteobacteria bacterium]|nr:1-deoxy-D-xylulose-5-phosphate synthase [Gammaproteobacteria bacterium]